MDSNTQNNYNSVATGIHLLTFGKWIFPLGNFVFPIILWMINANKSAFIDRHGKQAINFQISMTLYSITLVIIATSVIIGSLLSGGPGLWETMDSSNGFPFRNNMGVFTTMIATAITCGTALLILGITDLVCTIKAAIKANDGEEYNYPLTIHFIPLKDKAKTTNNLQS